MPSEKIETSPTASRLPSLSRRQSAMSARGSGFLRKLKLRLVVGEVSIFSEGSPDVVCHATGTYSIPDRR